MLFLKGLLSLFVTLALFSLFSLKAPKGDKAMSGLANAAIASFLVEAIYKYILGDFAGIPFFAMVGESNGALGGTAAAILVGISMGTHPVMAATAGVSLMGYGILPGFISAYIMHYVLNLIDKYVPEGIDTIVGALVAAAGSFGIAYLINPGVNAVISSIGGAITAATEQSPIVMGLLLGGIMKIVCTSPLSSMALTAMLQLTGLPMGIAAVACVGGSFTNGIMFARLKLGNKSSVAAVMLEPLTQADIITKNPIPIYVSNFIGGGLSGLVAVLFGIVNNAPGTAAPIPGLLAPFAFNPPATVAMAMGMAAMFGSSSGLLTSLLFTRIGRLQKYLYRSVEE